MDPALLREKDAFKKRAMAVPVVEKKREPTARPSSGPKKKKKSKLKRPKSQPTVVGKINHSHYVCMYISHCIFRSG